MVERRLGLAWPPSLGRAVEFLTSQGSSGRPLLGPTLGQMEIFKKFLKNLILFLNNYRILISFWSNFTLE